MPGTLVEKIEFPGASGERSFEVVIYDLLFEQVDCIVNAANGGLAHGGGVAAAISKAAGDALDDECDRIVARLGRVPTGSAVATTAGKLPFKGVIHAVGPMMGQSGAGDEQAKITDALGASFLIAHDRGWQSLSFPGISSGIFSVPHEICARGYLQAVNGFYQEFPDSSLKRIRLCLFKGPLVDAVAKAIIESR